MKDQNSRKKKEIKKNKVATLKRIESRISSIEKKYKKSNTLKNILWKITPLLFSALALGISFWQTDIARKEIIKNDKREEIKLKKELGILSISNPKLNLIIRTSDNLYKETDIVKDSMLNKKKEYNLDFILKNLTDYPIDKIKVDFIYFLSNPGSFETIKGFVPLDIENLIRTKEKNGSFNISYHYKKNERIPFKESHKILEWTNQIITKSESIKLTLQTGIKLGDTFDSYDGNGMYLGMMVSYKTKDSDITNFITQCFEIPYFKDDLHIGRASSKVREIVDDVFFIDEKERINIPTFIIKGWNIDIENGKIKFDFICNKNLLIKEIKTISSKIIWSNKFPLSSSKNQENNYFNQITLNATNYKPKEETHFIFTLQNLNMKEKFKYEIIVKNDHIKYKNIDEEKFQVW